MLVHVDEDEYTGRRGDLHNYTAPVGGGDAPRPTAAGKATAEEE